MIESDDVQVKDRTERCEEVEEQGDCISESGMGRTRWWACDLGIGKQDEEFGSSVIS
ncbi:hypothetical protein A2U01_0053299, partial [Trifolium medium]|nr:hypothetical protein [Trifolium medium]